MWHGQTKIDSRTTPTVLDFGDTFHKLASKMGRASFYLEAKEPLINQRDRNTCNWHRRVKVWHVVTNIDCCSSRLEAITTPNIPLKNGLHNHLPTASTFLKQDIHDTHITIRIIAQHIFALGAQVFENPWVITFEKETTSLRIHVSRPRAPLMHWCQGTTWIAGLSSCQAGLPRQKTGSQKSRRLWRTAVGLDGQHVKTMCISKLHNSA